MSESHNWHTLVEGQVYLLTNIRHMTLEDMQAIDQFVMAQMDTTPHAMLHIVFDTRYVLSIPALNDVQSLNFPMHPKMGYIITAGGLNSNLTRFIITMAAAILKARFQDVATLSEAYALLLAKNPSLPPLNTWTLLPDENTVTS